MNFKEYIDKDIEDKKNLLELLPMNTEARVKKYKDTIDNIIRVYQPSIESTKKYIDYKYNKLYPTKIDRTQQIEQIKSKITVYKENLISTNPNTSYYERLGFDMLIFELEHYYNYTLHENNDIIVKIISKFELASVKISAEDFKLNIFSYNYMIYIFKSIRGELINTETLKKIFWKCPNVYENIIISFRILIIKNQKRFESYLKIFESKILSQYNYKSRNELIQALYNEEINKEQLEEQDEADIVSDFISGELDFSIYQNTMNNLYGELDYFLINPIDVSNQDLLAQTLIIIDNFYQNIMEYQKYSTNEVLFENLKNTYNKNIFNLQEKQMKKDYKAQLNKINKLQAKAKKQFINKIINGENIDQILNKDEFNKCIEQQKMLNEIYIEYSNYDKMYFNLILKQNIHENSFISSIVELIVSYPFFSRSIIKSVFELENNEEVTDKYNEIFDLQYNRHRKLIDMKSIFSKENFERRLMDSYRFDNLNINETTFEEDNQTLAITNYIKLKNKLKISKFQRSLDEIEFLINIKKLKDEEEKV